MDKFINVGFGNSVNADKVVAVMNADTLPTKRLIGDAKNNNKLLDATCGRKVKAVLVLTSGNIMVCGLHTETICQRLNSGEFKSEED